MQRSCTGQQQWYLTIRLLCSTWGGTITDRPKDGWKKPREPVIEGLFIRDLIRLTKQASLGLLEHPAHPRRHMNLVFMAVRYQHVQTIQLYEDRRREEGEGWGLRMTKQPCPTPNTMILYCGRHKAP